MKSRWFCLACLALLLVSSVQAADHVRPEYLGQTALGPNAPLVTERTDLVAESFETEFPPAGWSLMTTGASYPWVQSDATSYYGNYSAYVQWGNPGEFQDEWLVTPALDASGLSLLYIEFFETGNYWASYGMTHEVLVSTTVPDDQGAFTPVLEMTPGTYDAPWLDSSGSEWALVEVDLSAYAGEPLIYVALRYTGDFADDWWVDGVRVYEPFDHDVKGVSVAPDGETWQPGTEVTPEFVVKNVGQNTETFDAELTIAANGVDFYTEIVTVGDLAPGDEVLLTYSSFITEAGNYYEFTGTTLLEGDEDPANDVAVALNDCFSGQRVPLGLLVTNWGCGPCVQANQALDAYIPTQGNDVALIRVHGWWPSSNDPMYLANTEQCDYLIEGTPTGADYAPHLWMDNDVDAGSDGAGYADYYENQKLVASPLEIDNLGYVPESGELLVFMDVLDPMSPNGDYRLFVAVTEDGVEAQGPNGEPIHNQAFRWLYPGTEGLVIDTSLGLHDYLVPLELDPSWVFENLRGTVYVQDLNTGKILNAGTIFLHEGSVPVEEQPDDELPQLATALQGAHPNPFNPRTTVTFSLDRSQQVRLEIFDMSGRLVTELASGAFNAGEHHVVWQGRDRAGQEVASGTYLLRMVTEQAVRSSKMMLVR